jgi:hypothetical protein
VARFERFRRRSVSDRVGRPPESSPDDDHKMILLLEYLSRCATQRSGLARAAKA